MMETPVEAHNATSINDLPEEVVEFILMKLSPYKDLKSANLVCSLWHRLVSVVQRKLQAHYQHCVLTSRLAWSVVMPDAGCRITERYSHCCCYFDKCLYVFGGCTATNTTLNDLWRFDLASREWIRPLASGTYPFPKACATFITYKDNLVLFGGWSHPTPFPLHQAARFFSELHIYKPLLNRWTHVTTLSHQSPQPVAGHSASVVGDMMVVFGGSQVPGVRTNELWLFDFLVNEWRQPKTRGRKPEARYGQAQITLDDSHILVLGGKGGGSPQVVYKDCWLLTLGVEDWTWEEIEVLNDDSAPAQLWCHAACKASDNFIVSLCRPAKVPESLTKSQQSPKVTVRHSKTWIPPREDQLRSSANGLPGTSSEEHMDQSGAEGSSSDFKPANGSEPFENSNQMDQSVENPSLSSNVVEPRGSVEGTVNPRPGLPSVRPNAMKNRQKQLEALLKYEKKFRHSENSGPSPQDSVPKVSHSVHVPKPKKVSFNPASLMVLHVLDISHVLESKTVSWQELKFDNMEGAPEETLFYTLVEGRGEVLMFGGIERDIQSLQRGYGIKSHTVNSTLHILKPVQDLM